MNTIKELQHATGRTKKEIIKTLSQAKATLWYMLNGLPSGAHTRKQLVLLKKHGAPHEFAYALIGCLGEISYDEMVQALRKYLDEWAKAGMP